MSPICCLLIDLSSLCFEVSQNFELCYGLLFSCKTPTLFSTHHEVLAGLLFNTLQSLHSSKCGSAGCFSHVIF